MDTRLTHWNINLKIEWIIQIINLTLTLISTLWITLLSEFGAEWGPLCIKSTDLTFFSMYSTSEGKWEFCTSNSVRSASSRQGGGSLGCRVGGSLRMRRILKQTHLSHFVALLLFFLHYVSSSVYTGAHLRAIERTLVLFLTRCRTAEFELEAGTEESVWTCNSKKEKHDATQKAFWW